MRQPVMSPRPMPRLALALPLLLMMVLVAGCSLIPEQQPVRLFTLPPASLPASDATARDLTLRVDTPSAGSPLNGSRLLVMPSPGEFQAYAGARWRDDIPPLLRDHLVTAFRLDGRLAAVVDDASRARSDANLASHLEAFHSRYREGEPEVVLRIEAQLIDETSRDVLASRRFEVIAASEDDSLDAVVMAFGRATDRLAGELVDWTLAQMAGGTP